MAIAALGIAACPGSASRCPGGCQLHSTCNSATAICACDPGFTSCGGACVSLREDPHNCGSCGSGCGGLDCVGGTCGCSLPRSLCLADAGPDAEGGVPFCADFSQDLDNCGACGSLCGPVGESMAVRSIAWQCFSTSGGPGVCACNGHYQSCQASSSATPDCIDVSADSQNCGACHHVCVGGLCKADVCDCSRPGFVACASTTDATDPDWCHLPLTTDTHCGDADPEHCGFDCTKLHSVCSAGACVCAPGFVLCRIGASLQCIDLSGDAFNCGACGHACTGGVCTSQACDCSAPGYVACSATTSTTDPDWCHLPELTATHCGDTDPSHCGVDCTRSGVPSAFCDQGLCSCLLRSGDAGTLCDSDGGSASFCADLLGDPLNCGACYASAPPFDFCDQGRPACNASNGEQLCGAYDSDGGLLPDASACANINTGDPLHCGTCFGPSADCDTWNGSNSICSNSTCYCTDDIDSTPLAPDAGPAAYCIMSAAQGQCSCNASQKCPLESTSLSWGHDIFPLFQTGPGGVTSASKLGCSAAGCHAGGASQAAGHLDLSDLDAGYTGLVTGPIFSGKICLTPPDPTTVGAFNCPCVAQVTPGATDSASSVLTSILSTGNYPQKCNAQLVHNGADMNLLVFSPCALLIVNDWIDAGALR
jgi:hypothetical protein